jgi:signal transduction histidine kinase/CRP-like cAMP-binding protein
MTKRARTTARRSAARKTPSRKRTRTAASGGTSPLLDFVRSNALFTGMERSILTRNLNGFKLQRYKAGELIFDEYAKGRDLYLIAEGRVRIKKYTKFGVESLLAVLHTGDFFGELSVIDGLPRSARAEAMDETAIVMVSPTTFRHLMEQSTRFAVNLMNTLAVRLRSMDQTFVLELGRNTLASKNKMDRLSRLIEAAKVVNSALDIDTLLRVILEVAAQSITADRGTLYLLDPATNELWSKVAQGEDLVEIRLPVGKGLAGYVAMTGETINITDAYKDPRFNPDVDRKSGYKTRNVLCMPMRNKEGQIQGVFQLLNRREGSFTAEDEAFIDALSVHAAIALENARLAQQMVQTERLSAVGRMASTIIHDIKNPMGTLRMYAQVIKKKSGETESAQLADEIIRQVDRFVTMTQEILDFSRGVSEIRLEEVPLGEAFESIFDFVEKDLAKKEMTLVRNFQYTGPWVLDIDKVSRVIYNLAGNAADAMKSGGSLTVTSSLRGGSLLLEFVDTGSGIPEEIRHRIFEPFFTSGKRHGTGLGLSIVKKILDDHHGSIELESEPGHGTTFRLLFPPA